MGAHLEGKLDLSALMPGGLELRIDGAEDTPRRLAHSR